VGQDALLPHIFVGSQMVVNNCRRVLVEVRVLHLN
jgi:hypothetical protein